MQTQCNVPACPAPGYVTPPETTADHSNPLNVPQGSALFGFFHTTESTLHNLKGLQNHAADKQPNHTELETKKSIIMLPKPVPMVYNLPCIQDSIPFPTCSK